jgi:hypothetical protein
MGNLFVDYEINDNFTFGMKFGLDSKSISTSSPTLQEATLVFAGPSHANDSAVTGTLPMTRDVNVRATYFFFAPYFKFSPFGRGAFLQIAPEIGILTSSNLTHIRTLASSTVTLSDGTIITNVKFDNGTQQQTLEDVNIRGAKSTRIAMLFAAGYEIPIFQNFSLLPQASYNMALSHISDDAGDNNWKISSFALILGLKYGL